MITAKSTRETESTASKVVAGFLIAGHLFADSWATRGPWNWFIAPLGVPKIGMAHAAGISILVMLVNYRSHDDSNDKRTWLNRAGSAFFAPLFCLAFGAIAHWLMVRP